MPSLLPLGPVRLCGAAAILVRMVVDACCPRDREPTLRSVNGQADQSAGTGGHPGVTVSAMDMADDRAY